MWWCVRRHRCEWERAKETLWRWAKLSKSRTNIAIIIVHLSSFLQFWCRRCRCISIFHSRSFSFSTHKIFVSRIIVFFLSLHTLVQFWLFHICFQFFALFCWCFSKCTWCVTILYVYLIFLLEIFFFLLSPCLHALHDGDVDAWINRIIVVWCWHCSTVLLLSFVVAITIFESYFVYLDVYLMFRLASGVFSVHTSVSCVCLWVSIRDLWEWCTTVCRFVCFCFVCMCVSIWMFTFITRNTWTVYHLHFNGSLSFQIFTSFHFSFFISYLKCSACVTFFFLQEKRKMSKCSWCQKEEKSREMAHEMKEKKSEHHLQRRNGIKRLIYYTHLW